MRGGRADVQRLAIRRNTLLPYLPYITFHAVARGSFFSEADLFAIWFDTPDSLVSMISSVFLGACFCATENIAMSKGLKIRAMVASVMLAGFACAVGLATIADRDSVTTTTKSAPAAVSSVSAKKASSDDLARRYRRVVRRRTVII